MNNFRTVMMSIALVLLVGLTGCGESKTEEQRMTDATAAFESGKYREALIELKNLLQDNPKNKDARILLAYASLEVGDPDAAAKELERAGRLGATSQEIYALQQRTWLRLGRFQELVENYAPEKSVQPDEQGEMQLIYAKALNGMDNSADAQAQYRALADSAAPAKWRAEGLVGLALLARAANDEDKAKELAEQALSVHPDSVSAHIALGQIAIKASDFDDAFERFTAGQGAEVINDEERFILLSGEAEAALGKADVEASKDAANRLFTLAPEHPITTYLMARVAYVSGDKEMAHTQAQKVLSEYPEFLPAQFLQGALSLERGEYPQAEMFLSNVVAAQPTNVEARRLLAESNLRLGQTTEAANILREGIRLGPGQQELASMLGRINLRSDNNADNILLLEKTLEANPDDEKTRLTLVASYIAAGDADRAQELIEAGDQDAISPERKAIVKLIAAMQAGDRQAAVAQADVITATWPENSRTQNMIGTWLYSQEMKVKGRTTLENAYAKNPNSGELATSLSRIDNNEGNRAEAIARLEEYLERQPESVGVWLALAASYIPAGDTSAALEVLGRARAANPDAYMPKVATVRMLIMERRFDDAVKEGEQLASAHENVAVAQFVYGRALYEDGQFDRSLEFLKKANSMEPGTPETLVYKARTEARLNQFAQAKKSYEELWEVNPGNIEAAQSIALLEQRRGNTAAAGQILEQLRELRPDDPRVDVVDADLKAERGNNKEAFELYEKAYSARPSRNVALKLAQMAPQQGADPMQYIRRWLEQSPDDIPARLALAQRLQQQGNDREAMGEYEIIIAARPDDSLVLNNLAWLHFQSDNEASRKRALELSRRAYEQNPNNAQIGDTYGWILFRSGNVEEGTEVLALAETRARDQGLSDSRDITYHYAAALSESGDSAGARLRLKSILNDGKPFYSREEAQRLLDSLAR